MAIYHCSVKTVSRSAGRSATAAAAYRAGAEIADERTGEIHDYTRKGGVESAELVLPAGAPEWAEDRAKLWNAAEQAETRKNSTVAREFEVALPSELPEDARRQLAHDFAREIVERHGVAADVAIHAPSKDGDERNHHAHILCSTRRLEAEGFTDKTRELDDKKTGCALVVEWRARWAELTNERLQAHGLEARIDHRSLKDQGIKREPTQHNGPTVTAMERRGIQTDRGDEGRLIQAANLERQEHLAAGQAFILEQQLKEAKAELQAQEEKRLASMTAKQLRAEAAQIKQTLQDPASLAERHPDMVARAEAIRQTAERQGIESATVRRMEERAKDAQAQAKQWRAEHGIRAALHDKGLMASKDLARFDQVKAQSDQERQAAAARLAEVKAQAEQLRQEQERQRRELIAQEKERQAPDRAKMADLETRAQDREQADRAALQQARADKMREILMGNAEQLAKERYQNPADQERFVRLAAKSTDELGTSKLAKMMEEAERNKREREQENERDGPSMRR